MIKVEKIQIKEFRGIRKLTLEFKGKNYAVCGPNGTGKSGVVDALEFVLTGNISRLSGKGMGNVSVKEHAPHVDFRSNPEKACVSVTLKIPILNNIRVEIERTVKNPAKPKISPSTPEILNILKQFDGHPEFVLSRREIIRYVISQPGNRSDEVQALLRLEQVGDLRSNFKTVANYYEKEAKDYLRTKKQTGENLTKALEIIELSKENILNAINSRRSILLLQPILELTSTTALNDGLETSIKPYTNLKTNKKAALVALKSFKEKLEILTSENFIKECAELKDILTKLSGNSIFSEGVQRERFLSDAINFVTEPICPVCDTEWDIQILINHIQAKLKQFEKAIKVRRDIEIRLKPVLSSIESVLLSVPEINLLAKHLEVDTLDRFDNYKKSMESHKKALVDFLPIENIISSLENISLIPEDILANLSKMEVLSNAIPEPTQQETARDFVIIAQDRLESYRNAAREAKKAEQRSNLANDIYSIYTEVSNQSLQDIYSEVESEFSNFYSYLNNDDEEGFSAKLTPSIGKLSFDVDFYGRGHFPPGAYHSEGHQDAMGLCLYLALMRKLQGKNFQFAVLDDVLMSVDNTHRRAVCKLLKEHFPEVQFVLTTHDEVWLKLMNTVGLIQSGNATRFSSWTPDLGPADWKTRDIWSEINDALVINDVHAAASLLRYYLEYIFREICEKLQVKVEFRGDGRYELGDTLAPAVSHFRELLNKGANASESWKQNTITTNLRERERIIRNSFTATNAEQWQVNPSVHYNEWANFDKNDFLPVVSSFKDLVSNFFCEKPECASLFYLTTTGFKKLDSVRCLCGNTNVNLKIPEEKTKIT